jgi:type VI secretion system secreted protein VgrG
MLEYSQATRPVRLHSRVAGDKLMVQQLTGEEHVSAPFHFTLGLLSSEHAMDGEKLVGSEASMTLEISEGEERVIHGVISRFVALGRDKSGLAGYRAELVPWLWFFSLSNDYRTFHEKTVPQIIEEVVNTTPVSGITINFRNSCIDQYPVREYCVQYEETSLDFIHRLLEEEGIFYFFEHTDKGHTMVLGDSPGVVKACEGTNTLSSDYGEVNGAVPPNVVLALEREDSAGTAEHRVGHVRPIPVSRLSDGTETRGIGRRKYYPTKCTNQEEARRYANLRAGIRDCLRQQVRGASNCPALQAGRSFILTGHFRREDNRTYQLLSVRHFAHAPFMVGAGGQSALMGGEFRYTNEFVAIPEDLTYRPPLVTPKPIVHGSQPAIVIGEAGSEIWTDEHSRVKVAFPWNDYHGDRSVAGACWARVSSIWAGGGFGWVQVPRVGDEVLVDFLDGDPDHPVVTGRLYNSNNMPPWPLPELQTRTGLRTRSSPDGGAQNANELYFEDKKGSEEIFLHAERTLRTEVEGDEIRTVGHDRTTKIQHHDSREIMEGDDALVVHKGHQMIFVEKGSVQLFVNEGAHEITIDEGNQKIELAKGDQLIGLGEGNQKIDLGTGNQETFVGLGHIETDAMQHIELKVGESSIRIDQMGVTIKGLNITIEGKLQTEVKGLMTQVTGDAMLKAKGGITMIN